MRICRASKSVWLRNLFVTAWAIALPFAGWATPPGAESSATVSPEAGYAVYAEAPTGTAALRTGCEAEEERVADLPAGTALTIRFAMNGCYSVQARVGGQTYSGFLPAAAVRGVDRWDQQRRNARSLDSPSSYSFFPKQQPANAGVAPNGANPDFSKASPLLQNVSELILQNRPAEALVLLEGELRRKPKDPQLLAMAGLAAYRADSAARAVDYLRASQAIQDNPSVSALLEKAEQEKQNDRSTGVLNTPKFSLRYEPEVLSVPQARTLSALLEQEYRSISQEVGCAVPERLAAIAQSRAAYLQSTGAAEWSGGLFDGRIRVAVMDGDGGTTEEIGPQTRRAFAHEIVHACLAASGQWPAWFHEGLAQRLSGDRLKPAQRAKVRAAAESGALPPLRQLTQNWSRMNAANAELAYQAALYAMELFYEHHQAYGIRNLIKNPDQLPRISAELDRLIRGE